MSKTFNPLHSRLIMARACILLLVVQSLLFSPLYSASATYVDEKDNDATRAFEAAKQALEQGPGVLTQERRAALIQIFGKITGSSEGLARLALNPSIGMGAEVSAGLQPAGWLLMPYIQAGVEDGKPSVAVGVKPPGVFGNLGGFQMKFKPSEENPSFSATFSLGGPVREGVLYQSQYTVEFQYKDKYDYMAALGLDSRNLPGARTTLWLMDQVLKKNATALKPVTQAEGPTAAGATVLEAVARELRQLLPPLFDAGAKFEKVSVGVGNSLTFDRKLLARNGIEAAGSIKLSHMKTERLSPGQSPGQGVKYSETSFGVGLGAKWDPQPSVTLAPRGEGEISAAFTYSTDPDKKLQKLDPGRVEFANQLRDGRFADAASLAMGRMNPILKADDIQSVIGKIRSSLESDNPNGVKIRIDDRLLAQALNTGTINDGTRLLDDLSKKLAVAGDQTEQQRVLTSFTKDLKLRFKAAKSLTKVTNLSVVSLKSLVGRAEAYANNWDQLPADLRAPGNISRIMGYVLDPANNDLLVVGIVSPNSPAVELDDLIVGVRAVWREGETPLVSLDPDPDNSGGPQHVRIQGIPRDSQFARTMLDADYIMKKIMGGVETVGSPGFVNFKQILARDRIGETRNRFWLYPVQPQAGDIQVSSDGNSALFMSSVQVLSEELLRTREGYVGTGRTMGAAEEAAISFTHHYADIERQLAVYKKLEGLFDIVLLARVWQNMKINSPLLDRLVSLPYKRVDVPASYEGITVKVYQAGDVEFKISGGVQVKLGAGPRTWLVLDDPELDSLRARSRALSTSGNVAASYSDLSLHVAEPDNRRRDAASLTLTTAVARLNTGDMAGAMNEVRKLVRADPYDAEPVAIRALINFYRNDKEAARKDALTAREMDPSNPMVATLSSVVLFQCSVLEGKSDVALQEIDFALKLNPGSVNSRILRATALSQLDRVAEAKAELKKAIELDPNSALAYTRLGMLEMGQGWLSTGQKWLKKAEALSKFAPNDPQLKAARALAEMASAGMGNSESHLALASQLAKEALANPACDPASAIIALVVLSGTAMIKDEWTAAEEYVMKARKIAPSNPDLLLYVVEFAHDAKRADLAQKYLAEAERLAPNYPAVRNMRQKIGR